MSTFKDILYKKEDNETWSEWNNRLPTDEDKRDYIGETIYAKIYDENKERAGKITGMLLEMDVEYLLPLLESNELLDEKIKEAYEILLEGEEEDMFKEDIYAKEREGFFYNYKLQEYCKAALWEEYDAEVQADALMETVLNNKYGAWGWGIKEEEAYKEEKSRVEKEEKEKVLDKEVELVDEEEECEQCGKTEEDCITEGMMFDRGCLSIYALDNRLLCPDCIPSFDNDDDDDSNVTVPEKPVTTLTVAEMIAALSLLPPDAKLVMTESGFYSKSDFAEVMLPRPYKVENDRFDCDLPTGTQVYIIGHSHQSYL
jgi:hypothetical protein